MTKRPHVGVLYQFFHPDDVVSARIFSELCADLKHRGWEVTAWPCNRACHHADERYPLAEEWEGVTIRRVWRPALRQASGLGRAINAAWMLAAWCVTLLRDRRGLPDVLVIGTDPVFGILVAPVVRKLLPDIRIVHWCFDLYPEYAIAEGMFREDSRLIRGLRRVLPTAYACCDLVADLGSCMRNRLAGYGHSCRKTTLTPWALTEPAAVELPDPATRRELFGDNPLGLLYSGNFGRPHAYADLLDLARRLRGSGIHFSFGVRGSRSEELRQAVGPDDSNVSFAGFAPEAALGKRLAAADIHVVSLRPEYTGLAVPSKFFGSLASGRPVIFAGPDDSAIARWIEEFEIGWVLNERTQERVAAELLSLRDRRDRLRDLQHHCHRVYQEHFCRKRVSDEWDRDLRALLAGATTLATTTEGSTLLSPASM
jgi:glycosyltransferase involved in cell wall biosynthesis